MKNLNTIFNVILTIAVIVLFVLLFRNSSPKQETSPRFEANDSIKVLPVAYVNVDTLLSQYQYSLDLNEEIVRQAESAHATLNQKGKALEAEMQEFQRKVDNNAFFDRASAEKQQKQIIQKQEDFQRLNQKLTLQIQAQQDSTNRKLRDVIMNEIKSYNEKHHYQMIISNTMNDNVLYAEEVYDITSDLVKFLNERYKSKDNQ